MKYKTHIMVSRATVLLVLPLLIYCPSAIALDYDERSLGKLFTTPAERQKIDSLKSGDTQQAQTQRITPSSIRVNGVVIRSKGKNTVWVNGERASGNQTVSGVKVLANSVSKKSKKVPVLVDGKSVRIKPGQSWSDDTEAVVDSY